MKKDRKKKRSPIWDYLFITIGITISAMGITLFLSKSNLVIGGLAGLAIIIEYITQKYIGWGIPMWLTNIVVNIPLFVISIKQRGFKFGAKSMYAAGYLSIALWFTAYMPPILKEENLLLSSIYGAIFIGIGIGLVLRASATTGGTDTLATIIRFKHKNLPISRIMLSIDSTIIVAGAVVFGAERAMYALIAVYVLSKVVSTILEGVHFAKAALIISDEVETIAEELMKRVDRGATSIKAKGMYTKKEKNLLFMVVSQSEIVELQKIVREYDPKAFITISDVREVLGEGFLQEL